MRHIETPSNMLEGVLSAYSEPLLTNDILTKVKNDDYGDAHDQLMNSHLVREAISYNDSPMFSKEQRERNLRQLFAKHGHEIEFTGNYPEDTKENQCN